MPLSSRNCLYTLATCGWACGDLYNPSRIFLPQTITDLRVYVSVHEVRICRFSQVPLFSCQTEGRNTTHESCCVGLWDLGGESPFNHSPGPGPPLLCRALVWHEVVRLLVPHNLRLYGCFIVSYCL